MSKIIDAYSEYVMPTYSRQPAVFVRGEGCYLYDEGGNAFLDFTSGLSINNLGHCHPAVVEAVRAQVGQLIHTCNLYYTPPGAELARLISENSLGGKVFFSNSGAEANECAIKLARKYGHESGGADKYKIVTLENGFHGRTMATLTATAQPEKQAPFVPLLPGFSYVPANDVQALTEAVDEHVCAIMLEPVQGEGGVRPLDAAFLEQARELADRFSALLVYDEVQTGLGRTGTLFAFERAGIKPDVMTLAKSLGGALPIGATVAAPEFSDVLTPGTHATTFGGGPVPCAAGVAVFGELLKPGFLEGVGAKGDYMKGRLEDLRQKGAFKEVRGVGLMLAADLSEPVAAAVVSKALAAGIILNNTSATTLRFLPPLIVEEGMIDRVVEFLQTELSD
jgi:predicted acetylornithine/succinylornithine family transaminase